MKKYETYLKISRDRYYSTINQEILHPNKPNKINLVTRFTFRKLEIIYYSFRELIFNEK